MEAHFSRTEWLLWALAGAASWLLLHPRGSTMPIDGLQFCFGAALCMTLQCLILCRTVKAFRTHLLWLASAWLWLGAGGVFWWLPWSSWNESSAELFFISSLATLWLATGVLQRAAFRPLRAGTRGWIVVPLLGGLLAMVLTIQLNVAFLHSKWPASVDWPRFFAFLGTLFGLLYGATTGAAAYAMLARPALTTSRQRA